jgi:hypothetical protein
MAIVINYNSKYGNNITYGKCTESPYMTDNLGFVTVSSGRTYIVPEEYANSYYINLMEAAKFKMESVATEIINGDWCPKYEVLWKNIPVFSYQTIEGMEVKYGYTRNQPDAEREYWYVAIKGIYGFVVDQICATPDFIERMGIDVDKWWIICHGYLKEGIDYEWNDLVTENSNSTLKVSFFSVDSPYSPKSILEIFEKIDIYENCVSAYNKKIRSKKHPWNSLDHSVKRNWCKELAGTDFKNYDL